jgi:endonuclease/exonuclease/phosphatase family metal-dependent hydrolase
MFRILQFNMQYGQGWDDSHPDEVPVNLDATVAELLLHKADVIILQEVEHANPGGAQIEPPPNFSYLKEKLTQYDSFFAYPKADPRELPFGIGLAIFSRAKLRNLSKINIPSPPIEFEFKGKRTTPTDRLLISATTEVEGRDIQVFNVHLLAFFMLGSSSTMFPWQRNMVAERLSASSLPSVLGGDFNVSEHSSLVSQFASHGFRTVQDKVVTWRRRPFVLDHIFHSTALKCVSHAVVPTMASDHHALVADFEFAP